MTTISTTRTKAASIEQLKAAFATAAKDVATAAEYALNCETASVDAAGDIWIENPQSGHWLADDEIKQLVEHTESEVGTSVFDWLGCKGCVAALKTNGVSQPKIAERLGITLSALEKKIRGTNPTSMLETNAMIDMIAEHAMTTVTYTISDMRGDEIRMLATRTMQVVLDQNPGDVCELAETILTDHGFPVWDTKLDGLATDGVWEIEGWDGGNHIADITMTFDPRG